VSGSWTVGSTAAVLIVQPSEGPALTRPFADGRVAIREMRYLPIVRRDLITISEPAGDGDPLYVVTLRPGPTRAALASLGWTVVVDRTSWGTHLRSLLPRRRRT
jgi:hypothetical protein